MPKPKVLFCFSMLVLMICSFSKQAPTTLPFSAKFYDENGTYIGSFGTIDPNSPVYIASIALLFPEKTHQTDWKMTPQDIVSKVGTEIISDRFQMILELNVHVGLFKLPPKAHRIEIQKAIEETHLDAKNSLKMDSIDFEIGGCGYHNNAGELLHLRAKDGQTSARAGYPYVAVFDAVDYDTKVDSNQQLITDSGSRLISERRIEYTWHTHPPKSNGRSFEQTPSVHDFNFGNNYQYIKQHFLISLKYKSVYYYGFGTRLPEGDHHSDIGVFNFRINYELFFSLE
jgi:hypothetical protein